MSDDHKLHTTAHATGVIDELPEELLHLLMEMKAKHVHLIKLKRNVKDWIKCKITVEDMENYPDALEAAMIKTSKLWNVLE